MTPQNGKEGTGSNLYMTLSDAGWPRYFLGFPKLYSANGPTKNNHLCHPIEKADGIDSDQYTHTVHTNRKPNILNLLIQRS